MERRESQSIGDILRLALQENCMQDHLDGFKAAEAWHEIMGDPLSAQCGKPVVKEGIMTVGVPNAALRHELAMSRSRIIRAINERLAKQVVSEIRFTS